MKCETTFAFCCQQEDCSSFDNFDPDCVWNGSYTPQTMVLQHQERSYTRAEMHKIFKEIWYYIAEVTRRPSLDS